jgi:hypothetical protein
LGGVLMNFGAARRSPAVALVESVSEPVSQPVAACIARTPSWCGLRPVRFRQWLSLPHRYKSKRMEDDRTRF